MYIYISQKNIMKYSIVIMKICTLYETFSEVCQLFSSGTFKSNFKLPFKKDVLMTNILCKLDLYYLMLDSI